MKADGMLRIQCGICPVPSFLFSLWGYIKSDSRIEIPGSRSDSDVIYLSCSRIWIPIDSSQPRGTLHLECLFLFCQRFDCGQDLLLLIFWQFLSKHTAYKGLVFPKPFRKLPLSNICFKHGCADLFVCFSFHFSPPSAWCNSSSAISTYYMITQNRLVVNTFMEIYLYKFQTHEQY